jgi:hypothetical protein
MIVVAAQRLHDAGISAQAGAWPDEDANGARANEPVDEILGQLPVDLIGPVGRAFAPIEARKEDIDVEPVLV